jgi:hypothetical protein
LASFSLDHHHKDEEPDASNKKENKQELARYWIKETTFKDLEQRQHGHKHQWQCSSMAYA